MLYLKGISTGDFQEALSDLMGPDAPNLSPSVLSRLTADWQADYDTTAVAVADAGRAGEVRFWGEIANTPDTVASMLRKLGGRHPRMHFVYKARRCGYGIYRQIMATEHDCEVVSPAQTPRKPGDRIKTDRRDAIFLARLSRAGELTSVWVPAAATRSSSTGFPRCIGQPTLVLRREAIPAWHALRARVRGRQNAWRAPMVDPATTPWLRDSDWASDWQAWNAGQLIEDRPQIPTTAAALGGDTTLAVDETSAPAPVTVGAVISHADWPMIVTGRSGAGAVTVLEVEMLRVPVPPGAMIDLIPRGVFLAAEDAMGNPAYDRGPTARIEMSFQEWITR